MAYWEVNHGTHARRGLSSQPASYNDLLHAALVQRGVDPGSLKSQVQPTPGGRRPGKPSVVRAVNGRMSAAVQAAGDQWHTANMPREMEAAGSDPAAIKWLFESDE